MNMPALQKLKSLTVYPSARTTAEWAEVDAAIRNTAFFSATIEDEHVLTYLKKMVEYALEEGLSMQEFTRVALHMLENISVQPDTRGDVVRQEAIETLFNPTRLRLVFRTQSELAHGYAQTCEHFSDRALRMFPAWRFVRQPGAKESQKRPDHVKHEGAVRLKTDVDFWNARNRPEIGGFGNPFPPFGFNSWCRVEEVSRAECERLGLIKPGAKVPKSQKLAEHSFAESLSQIGTASTVDLSADAVERIKQRCKAAGITLDVLKNELSIRRDKTITTLKRAAENAWINELF